MKKQKTNKKTISRVIKYVGRYKIYLAISILSAFLSSLLALYIPILTGEAIDLAVGKNNVDFEGLGQILLRFLICIAIIVPLQWIMALCNNKIAFGVVKDLRKSAFDKLQKLPIGYIDSHPRGDTVSRIINDADRFADGLVLGFSQFFTGIVTIVGTLVFMFLINPIIALAVVLLTPLSLLVARFIANKTYALFIEQTKDNGALTACIDESIENQKLIRAFSYEDETREKFEKANKKLRESSLKAVFASSLTNPSTRFVNSMVYAVSAGAGALLAISNPMFTAGKLTGFLIYANQYTKPFNEISGVLAELQSALAGADRIFELVDEKEVVETGSDSVDPEKTVGKVEFNKVSFSYDKKKTLIKDLSFSARAGQKIAIVGPTGCGKTTLINLLMRFYETDGGEILIDGKPIKEMKIDSLRSLFGMVLQETWIKNGTVRENIAMGRPDATDEEIIAAARACHAHSFIKRLPKGYDTVIKDNDGLISQGQKQLICICRVMIAPPPLLILDEATSSIDTRTELKIRDAFSKLMKGRTSFIVAHRLRTIMDADLILVMKDGDVIERGTHSELLAQNGFYTKLYSSQFE